MIIIPYLYYNWVINPERHTMKSKIPKNVLTVSATLCGKYG